jgi:hypothetical protein
MKRIIRLTESDLARIVKRVVNEQQPAIDQMFKSLKSLPDNETTKLWSDTKKSLDELQNQLKIMIGQVVRNFPKKERESERALSFINEYFNKIKNLEYVAMENDLLNRLLSPELNKGYVRFGGSRVFDKISNTLNQDFKNTKENLNKIKTHIDNSTDYLKNLQFM